VASPLQKSYSVFPLFPFHRLIPLFLFYSIPPPTLSLALCRFAWLEKTLRDPHQDYLPFPNIKNPLYIIQQMHLVPVVFFTPNNDFSIYNPYPPTPHTPPARSVSIPNNSKTGMVFPPLFAWNRNFMKDLTTPHKCFFLYAIRGFLLPPPNK